MVEQRPLEVRPPWVVAHRGASAQHPEHTLGAYVAALDAGADGLECDVRLTADGHLVCVHDRDLRRTGANHHGVVSAMELSQLERIDLSSWKNPWSDLDDEAPDTDPELGRLLTLRRLLETTLDYDRPVRLAIETKHPTRYAGLVERRLAELLDDFGWTGADAPVQVMSFSWLALRRMARLTPDLDLVMLVESRQQWARAKPFCEPEWLAGPGIEVVREHPDLVRRMVHEQGRRVHCWVVNDLADVDLCLELGIEAVITDEPDKVRAYLSVDG